MNENSIVSGTTGRGLKGNGCSLQVENVRFFQNTVVASNAGKFDVSGGAISLVSESELTVASSTFESNSAEGDGGGIMCSECVKIDITGSVFLNNIAGRGGGLAVYQTPLNGKLTFTTFTENQATKGGGGAIYREGTAALLLNNNVTFKNNVALYGNDKATDPYKAIVYRHSSEDITNFDEINQPSVFLSVLDRYNAIVKESAVLSAVTPTSEIATAPLFNNKPEVINVQTGTAEFNNLKLFAQPGTYNIAFTAVVGVTTFKTHLSVTVSKCSLGWQLKRLDPTGFRCEKCPVGTIGDGETCTECDVGSSSSEQSFACTSCAPGRFQDLPGQSDCIDCLAGTFTSATGSTTCMNCLPATQSNLASISCTDCVRGEVQRPNDRTFCFVCDKDTYSLIPGSEIDGNTFKEDTKPDPLATCNPCKTGASCTKGLITAKNGWWRPGTNDSFYKCKTPTACLGAANDKLDPSILVNLTGHRTSNATIQMNEHSFNESCAPGYSGRLCHRCIAGWSRDGPDVCKVCIAHGAGAKWMALAGVALVFFVFGECHLFSFSLCVCLFLLFSLFSHAHCSFFPQKQIYIQVSSFGNPWAQN